MSYKMSSQSLYTYRTISVIVAIIFVVVVDDVAIVVKHK
jgi:hypothetical protein